MKHRFYDLHGVDWAKVRDTYEPLLAHIGNQEDLHDVMQADDAPIECLAQ